MDAIEKAISRNELARHCKRETKGAEMTVQLIAELLLEMGTAPDSLGTPVFNDRILTIWEEKKTCSMHPRSPRCGSVYTHRSYLKR